MAMTLTSDDPTRIGSRAVTICPDLDAKGVFYRLQAGPLAGAGQAKGLCEALALRNVQCLVITP